MNNTWYRCAMCGKVFESAWSDEEAEAELAQRFSGSNTGDCEIVCDACYQELPLPH